MRYPFTPEWLDAAPEPIAERFRALEDTVIQEIARQLTQGGELNESSIQRIRVLRGLGLDMDAIEKAVAETAGISVSELDALLDDAVKRNEQYYGGLLDQAGMTAPDVLAGAEDLEAIRRQTQDELVNLTQSMGFVVRQGGKRVLLEPGKAYQWALDQAELEVLSGATGYNQAISRAVRELAAGGVKKVQYESGHVDQIDVAARRAVMTGVGQTCDRYTEQAIESLGTDLVEVSAHGGARSTGSGPENHASWQGKVYRWAAKPRTSRGSYPDFERVTGYGTGPGLGGWNCRHRFFPFVEGVSQRAYTDRELREIDPRPFVYQGKTYNAYEATQKQREIERTVRRLTREQKAFEAAGLSEDAQAASIRARRLRKEYREFSAAAGLKTQPERMKVLYSEGLLDTERFAPLRDFAGRVSVKDRFSAGQYVVDVGKPKITGVRQHVLDNLAERPDRKGLNEEAAQRIIDNSRLTLYQADRQNLKFLSDEGYVIINVNREVVTIVPEKLRKKYRDYLGE